MRHKNPFFILIHLIKWIVISFNILIMKTLEVEEIILKKAWNYFWRFCSRWRLRWFSHELMQNIPFRSHSCSWIWSFIIFYLLCSQWVKQWTPYITLADRTHRSWHSMGIMQNWSIERVLCSINVPDHFAVGPHSSKLELQTPTIIHHDFV